MKKRMFVCLAVFFLSFGTVSALEIEGVQIPETLDSGAETLVLNGAGVRNKLFVDLYVCGLYLKEKQKEPRGIVDSDQPMAMRLHIVSSMITSEKMEKATREGFENATGGNTGPISEEIEKFIGVFKREIKENDVFDLFYSPTEGVKVYKNQKLEETIPGLEFKKAMFGIWLGEKPAQKSLKQSILGM